MPSQYKLTYYDIMGLAEPMRYMLAIGGVDYDDHRIPKDDTTYPKLPPVIKDDLPWGKVPVLEVDGKKISQSTAINRFLAKRFNLCGADEFEAAKCDELNDAMKDFGQELRGIWMMEDGPEKVEMFQKLQEVAVPYYMGRFNKEAEANEHGWLVGKKITWADIVIAHYITLIVNRSKMPIVEPFPALKKVLDNVYNYPEIKAWIAKRPDTTD